MREKPSFYAIIPANVRYDKELTPNAKLLYGEITALCNDKGYCWATNSYFAELYGVSNVSISKWINILVKKGYIKSIIKYKDGTKEIINRYLTLVNDPIKEKFNSPIKEKFKDNNTSNNNTKNNTINNLEKNNFSDFSKPLDLSDDEEKPDKSESEDKPESPFGKLYDVNVEFGKGIMKDQMWIDRFCMNHKILAHPTNFPFRLVLLKFTEDISIRDVTHPNLKEFKNHFNNWVKSKTYAELSHIWQKHIKKPKVVKDDAWIRMHMGG